jgi:hypothetical protein
MLFRKGERKMRKALFALMVVALLGMIACAKPPQAEIDAAKAALQSAKQAEAATYAPESLKAATNKEAALDTELATQQNKFFKSYKVATALTTELKQLAEKAKTDAVAGKAKAKADAEAAITAAEAAMTTATEDLKKAPKGKGSQADIAAMQGDLDAATKTIEDAKADMTAEKFLDAKSKADNAKAQAEKVTADVQAAIELKKGGKKK